MMARKEKLHRDCEFCIAYYNMHGGEDNRCGLGFRVVEEAETDDLQQWQWERSKCDRMYSEMASIKLLDICDEIESYEKQLQSAYSFICYYKRQERFKEFCEHEALIDAEIPLDRELIVNGRYST